MVDRVYPEYAVSGTQASSVDFNEMVIEGLIHLINMTAGGTTLHDLPTPREIGHDVGDIKVSARANDSGARWLLCDGRTIGSANSSATARANADMLALYTLLWTNFTNTELVIQTSAGSPTTRGASASLDFAADKRMPLPDLRGRVVAGMDDPGNGTGAANRVTAVAADILGGASGAETHTLTTAQLASHSHSWGPIGSSGGYGVVDSLTANSSGSLQTGNAGSGNAHNNMQPTFYLNYLIYTGL